MIPNRGTQNFQLLLDEFALLCSKEFLAKITPESLRKALHLSSSKLGDKFATSLNLLNLEPDYGQYIELYKDVIAPKISKYTPEDIMKVWKFFHSSV